MSNKKNGRNTINLNTNNGSINIGDTYINRKVVKRNNIPYDPNIHISNEELVTIKKLVDKYVSMASDGQNTAYRYKEAWNILYEKLNVTSYYLIHKEDFHKAITVLNQLIGYKGRRELRKRDLEEAKKKDIRGIQTRRKKLGISDEELINIAISTLELKQPISSIKELSPTRIRKLYRKIMSIKQPK